MNNTVERIKNGQEVAAKEVFEIVNLYELTHVNLMDSNNQTLLAMQVNQFAVVRDSYEFSQDCSVHDNQFTIKQDDVLSVDAEWNEEANALFIIGQLKNDLKLKMMILFPEESFKVTETEDFYETDVYDFKEFLDMVMKSDDWYCMMVRLTDVFGFDLKMRNPERTYIDDLDDDWELLIGDNLNEFKVPITDDCVNRIYRKDGGSLTEYMVKPYGQPFMEIKMLFFTKNQ